MFSHCHAVRCGVLCYRLDFEDYSPFFIFFSNDGAQISLRQWSTDNLKLMV